MTKKSKLVELTKLLREKKGYPDLSYLMKLNDSELTWLMMSIVLSRNYQQNLSNSAIAKSNKDLEVSASPTPKESQKAIPSLNPDII